MKTIWTSALLVTAGLMAVPASAQELYISAKTVADQGITLIGWGNGRVAEADEVPFEGTNSLRFSSRNFFQGGILNFDNPVNLSSPFADRSNLLHFTFNVPSAGGSGGALGGPGGRGGLGGPPGAGGPGGLGGPPGAGGPGGQVGGPPGGGGLGGGSQQATDPLEQVRVVVTTTDGLRSEGYLDISTSLPDDRGWMSVGIPLQAINGFERTNKTVKSIAISGDAVATYYLGSIKVINDTTPVFADMNYQAELNLAFGDQITFAAGGSAGATPVKFIWDFDSRDGVTGDVEGQTVTHRFRNPGEFEVTLTAVDIYGLKQPYTTKIKVVVNP